MCNSAPTVQDHTRMENAPLEVVDVDFASARTITRSYVAGKNLFITTPQPRKKVIITRIKIPVREDEDYSRKGEEAPGFVYSADIPVQNQNSKMS